MSDGYVTVVVGIATNGISRQFLIAPENHYISVNDEVMADDGFEYDVMFSKSYVPTNDSMCIALRAALGSPKRIMLHKVISEVKWGGENEDAADTPCDDDSRSWSRDGDGSTVFGE